MSTAKLNRSEMQHAIEEWMRAQLGAAEDVSLSEFDTATGGLSSETLFCTLSWRDDAGAKREKLVLKVQPDDHMVIPDGDVVHQYQLLKTLGETTSLPVPKVHFVEPTGAIVGVPFFAMGEVQGAILLPGAPQAANPKSSSAPSWSSDELEKIYDNALGVLADLHRVPVDGRFDFIESPSETALDETLAQLRHWYEWAKRGRDLGVIDVGMAWVTENRPNNRECSICWGDARPGNLVVAEDLSIAGVLDWEMAVLGPPEADLGWWLMFEKVAFEGFRSEYTEGVPSREATIKRYQDLLGREVVDIHYFEVLAALRLAVINVRLLELEAYGPMSDGWIIEQDQDRMIIGDPFTRLLASWLNLDVPGGLPAYAV
jgi:aminoglycoside phosphotransferase (APT) family kinase protein